MIFSWIYRQFSNLNQNRVVYLLDLNRPRGSSPQGFGKGSAFLILLIFAFLFFKEAYLFFYPPKSEQTLVSIPLPEKNQLKTLEHSAFLQTPLFGSYKPPLETAVIKPSHLNIQVLGILFSKKEAVSQVILKIDGSEENTYNNGQAISRDIFIKKITPNSIVISHGGRLERLSLPEERLAFSPPPQAVLP